MKQIVGVRANHSKFQTKQWVSINDESCKTQEFKVNSYSFFLWDFCDACIVFKETIRLRRIAARDGHKRKLKLCSAYKLCFCNKQCTSTLC